MLYATVIARLTGHYKIEEFGDYSLLWLQNSDINNNKILYELIFIQNKINYFKQNHLERKLKQWVCLQDIIYDELKDL